MAAWAAPAVALRAGGSTACPLHPAPRPSQATPIPKRPAARGGGVVAASSGKKAGGGGSGGKKAGGFSDHNARWLKPAARRKLPQPASSDEDEEESELEEGPLGSSEDEGMSEGEGVSEEDLPGDEFGSDLEGALA